jgi:hypothetical protein
LEYCRDKHSTEKVKVIYKEVYVGEGEDEE